MRSTLRPGFPLEARRIAALTFEMVHGEANDAGVLECSAKAGACYVMHLSVLKLVFTAPVHDKADCSDDAIDTLHTGCTMWRAGKFVRSISNVMGGVTIRTRSSSQQLFQDKMQFNMMHLLHD